MKEHHGGWRLNKRI